MNHIVFCINNKFVFPLCVLIKSILLYNSNSKFIFHIISNDLSNESKKLLLENINKSKSSVIFHVIDIQKIKDLIIRENDRVTIETYFRLLIPFILDSNISKVLYLDVDMLCVGNISSLFQLDLTDFSTGMSPDTHFNDIERFNRLSYDCNNGYYCAGLMLFNLQYWREHNISEKCISFIKNNPSLCLWHDQDAINKVLNGTIKSIDIKYNALPNFYHIFNFKINNYSKKNIYKVAIDKKYWDLYTQSLKNPIIIHYAGNIKPWHKEYCNGPFFHIWFKIFNMTTLKKNKLFNFYTKSTIKKMKFYIKKILKLKNYSYFPKIVYDIDFSLCQNI